MSERGREDDTVRVRKNNRKTIAMGTLKKGQKSEARHLRHVGLTTEHIGYISQFLMRGTKPEDDDRLLKKKIYQDHLDKSSFVVQSEVRDSMCPSNNLLQNLMELLLRRDSYSWE